MHISPKIKLIWFALITSILSTIYVSCQKSTEDILTQEERTWLNNNHGKIEILFGYQEPPNAFHNNKNEYVGLLVDYQKEIEESIDYRFVFKEFKTWEGLMKYSKTSQNYVIIGCARTPKRETYLSFTNTIVKIPYVIISQKNRGITTMKSLIQKDVCTVSDYAVNDYIEHCYPEIRPIHFNNDLECIRAVSTGTCDAMLANQMYVTHILNEHAISNLLITGESGYINRLSVAVSKNDPILFGILDKTIDNIPTERKKELYDKWIHARSDKFSKKTWLTLLSILSILITALTILWIWLLSLRKRVAKQTRIIRSNEENLRITLNSIGDALIVTNIHGQITRMNPIAEELTGWSFNEAENKHLENVFKIINSKTKKTVENPVKKVIASGTVVGLADHTELISKNGTSYQIADSGAPIKNQTGEISGVVLVFRDVTEAYRMQTALEESEALYRSIIENSNDAVFLMYNKHFEFINSKFEELIGYSIEEIGQVDFDSLVAPESLDLINSRIQEMDKSKLSPKFEFICISKSGKRLTLEVSTSYLPYKNSIASQGIIRDISVNKKHEAELIKAKEMAEESDRLKSIFLASMSHELRTPLNAVIGFSSLIQPDVDTKKVIRYSNIINTSGKHLLGVIEDIFDISLIETGDLKVESKPINPIKLLEETHEIITNEQCFQNKTHITITLDKSIEVENITLQSDSQRIKQVLINLVKNALKFTNKGRVSYGCALHHVKEKTFVKFFVKDTGIGIPQDMQSTIFEAFRQADESHTRIYGGTGLGLTICHKLTQIMGGEIWVESREGVGSNFFFTIPAKDKTQMTNSNRKTESNDIIDKLKNKTILVAEDDKPSYAYIKALLSSKNINCIGVNNGAEAIEYCEKDHHIDLILMDINMPKINGLIATQRIKKIRPNIPIIAQTAIAIEGDREKVLAAGCDDYISKPVEKNELFDKILACLNLK